MQASRAAGQKKKKSKAKKKSKTEASESGGGSPGGDGGEGAKSKEVVAEIAQDACVGAVQEEEEEDESADEPPPLEMATDEFLPRVEFAAMSMATAAPAATCEALGAASQGPGDEGPLPPSEQQAALGAQGHQPLLDELLLKEKALAVEVAKRSGDWRQEAQAAPIELLSVPWASEMRASGAKGARLEESAAEAGLAGFVPGGSVAPVPPAHASAGPLSAGPGTFSGLINSSDSGLINSSDSGLVNSGEGGGRGELEMDLCVIEHWLARFIDAAQAAEIASRFRDEDIGMEALVELTKGELVELGVSKMGWQKILQAKARQV